MTGMAGGRSISPWRATRGCGRARRCSPRGRRIGASAVAPDRAAVHFARHALYRSGFSRISTVFGALRLLSPSFPAATAPGRRHLRSAPSKKEFEHAHRHRKILQYRKGLRLHPARWRRERRLCAHLVARAFGHGSAGPERPRVVRAGAGQARLDERRHPAARRIISVCRGACLRTRSAPFYPLSRIGARPMDTPQISRARAAAERANGDASTLSNVKERCERAARAWEEIADRQERTAAARIERDSRVVARDSQEALVPAS